MHRAVIARAGKIALEGDGDARERNVPPRYLGGRKQPGLDGLVTGSEYRFGERPTKEHVDLPCVNDIHQHKQGSQFDPGLCFLPGFPQGRVSQRFAEFHETGRYRPEPVTGLDRAPAQEDRAPVRNDAAHDEARVFIVNLAAIAADVARPVIAVGYLHGDWMAALGTEIHGSGTGSFQAEALYGHARLDTAAPDRRRSGRRNQPSRQPEQRLHGTVMRHVLVCTTEYADHWAGTLAKKRAQTAAMSDAERQRIRDAVPEDHADGHRGQHCGQTMGGPIYELYQRRLREAGVADVVVSPNACIAQHAWGCVVMVYPDGIWYRIQTMADAERILEEHLIGGRPVMDLIHRRLRTGEPPGVRSTPAVATSG